MSTLSDIQANLGVLGMANPSVAAIYNEFAEGVAGSIDNTVTEINNGQSSILSIITSKNYGKAGYYTDAALAFQYGYSLSISTTPNPVTGVPTLLYYYPVIDATAKIVSQAAFVSNGGGLFLKIASLNTSTNLLQPLTSMQLAAFTPYFALYELPGLPVTIINNSANILNFNAICTYYAQYDLPTLQANIAAALDTFRNNFSFNGVLYTTDLETYMANNVPGVRSFFTSGQTIDSVPFTSSVVLTSGYFNYFSAILTQITYSAI